MFTAIKSVGAWMSRAMSALFGDEDAPAERKCHAAAPLPRATRNVLTLICDHRQLSARAHLEDVDGDCVGIRCDAPLRVGDKVRCSLHEPSTPAIAFLVVWKRGETYGLSCARGGWSHLLLREYTRVSRRVA